jgi:ribosomal protein S18 acetylase RimI-like enzyme
MKQDFYITEIEMEKLEEALNLVWQTFIKFEAPDYCQEGIQEFKRFLDSSVKQQLLDNKWKMWTCSDKGKVIGVLAVRDVCHISLLFVDSAYHRKGIARSMLEKIIIYCKENGDCDEITVNSSPYAIEIYHKLGFRDTDKEQLVNGIRFIPMKRSLCTHNVKC